MKAAATLEWAVPAKELKGALEYQQSADISLPAVQQRSTASGPLFNDP
jgi:hypothetical protein